MEYVHCGISRKESYVGRRIAVSFVLVALARLFYFIPMPGIDAAAVWSVQSAYMQLPRHGWFDVFALLHVGNLRNVSLFSLGILPYVNACIIIQILTFLLPGVERFFFSSRRGPYWQQRCVLGLTLALSLFYGMRTAGQLQMMEQLSTRTLLVVSGPALAGVVSVSIAAAVFFQLIIARLIGRFGLGHGVGLLFASEVLVRQIIAIDQLCAAYARFQISTVSLLCFLAAVGAFLAVVRRITKFSVPLQLCAPNAECFQVHIRPDWLGVWPLLLSEAVIARMQPAWGLPLVFGFGGVLCGITLLYSRMIYQPRRFYELLLLHRCRPYRDRRRLEAVFNAGILQVVAAAYGLFCAMYFLPIAFVVWCRIPILAAGIFGGYGIIVLIGVWIDLREQAEFYRALRQSPVENWCIVRTVADEMEAETAVMCLRSQGIACALKPQHFRWALPVRTVASSYLVYVARAQAEQAARLLGTPPLEGTADPER